MGGIKPGNLKLFKPPTSIPDPYDLSHQDLISIKHSILTTAMSDSAAAAGTKDMRLHIGSISAQLAQDPSTLETRLAKYGSIIKPLELHQKPTAVDYFGYVTVSLSNTSFGQLKSALNGVKFKGSVLSVAEARPDWKQRWEADHAASTGKNAVKLTKDQAIRKYERPNREIDVIPGRERTTKRRNKTQMTVRVIIGDRKKIVQWNKKKLWGFMKEKQLEHLVAEYAHGKWRDHNGDIVETVDMTVKPVKKISTLQSSTTTKAAGAETTTVNEEEEEDEEMKEERERNLNILESMFGGAGSDEQSAPMPMRMDDSEESDWEALTSKKSKITADPDFADPEEFIEPQEEKKAEPESEEVEEESSASSSSSSSSEESQSESESESEDEAEKQKEEDTEPKKNSTSTLRALFNPTEEATPFSLFGGGDDEDIDEDIVMDDPIETPVIIHEAPKPSEKAQQPAAARVYASTSKGLFFPHFDSPFLNSQSQVAGLAKFALDKEAWEKEFYEQRGEWNRTLRRRRRDVVRQIQKKNQAKRRTVAI